MSTQPLKRKRGRPPKAAGAVKKPKKVKRLPAGVPNPVDIHVGARVRLRRTLMGLNQTDLGNAVGLTFQQVQKYENGANRISASRLFEFSRILDVPVSFFFDDLPEELRTHEGRTERGLNPLKDQKDPLARRETLELVRAYYKIDDPKVRERMFKLTKVLANMEDSDD